MIQLSILKITEYGPWTLTLGSDREHELQMLQASLYKHVQELFSAKNCLVFLNKSDEFFVVSNGLSLEDHIEIQKSLKKSLKSKPTQQNHNQHHKKSTPNHKNHRQENQNHAKSPKSLPGS